MSFLRRHRKWLAALGPLAVALAGAIPGASPAAEPAAKAATGAPTPHLVQAPFYGDTLFDFFQAKYFTAITTLMASQQFDRVSPHADEAEVLRGGMLLSYGLHREAGEIFEKLIEKGAEPPVRDRAWFYLAKIRYQRGFIDQALQAIERVGDHLSPDLNEDRVLLHANLLMLRGDNEQAAALLRTVPVAPNAGRYARFNLGVALLRAGDAAGGKALLDALGQAPAEDEEYRSLRDKANVALGFSALAGGEPTQARTYLERVRLRSPQAGKALLGFGWAADSLKDPKLALVPWTELEGRDPDDAAVLEAHIAVPYAYAELGAYGQALQRYRDAIAAYEREAGALDESIAAIRSGKLVQDLQDLNPGEEMGWFWNIRELPDMPHASQLTHVLARHEFQEAFKNYRDLLFLQRNLSEWKDKLGAFDDMLATRRKAYSQRLPEVRSRAADAGVAGLQQRAQALVTQVQEAQARQDGRAFATERELALIARLEEARATVARMTDPAEAASARERLRRVEGAMTWELAQAYPERLWEARKGLKAIESGLQQAQVREAELARAQRAEPAKFDAFQARIAALGPRIAALQPRVSALLQEQRRAVEDVAVAALQEQKDRLAVYGQQARFAVAQLVDRARTASEGGDEAKP